jgi:hypothetical protein
MEPETRGIPIFCNPEKRCLFRRLTSKHLTSCFAKSFLELELETSSVIRLSYWRTAWEKKRPHIIWFMT